MLLATLTPERLIDNINLIRLVPSPLANKSDILHLTKLEDNGKFLGSPGPGKWGQRGEEEESDQAYLHRRDSHHSHLPPEQSGDILPVIPQPLRGILITNLYLYIYLYYHHRSRIEIFRDPLTSSKKAFSQSRRVPGEAEVSIPATTAIQR